MTDFLKKFYAGNLIATGLTALITVLSLGGCAPLPPREAPTPIEISISADTSLNPTELGRASPVLLKIYQMSGKALFQKADFFTLIEETVQIKHDELIAVHELMLLPGETITLPQNIHPDTRFIGVVAAYRDLQGSLWRSLACVPPPHLVWPWTLEYQYRIFVGANKVIIDRAPKRKPHRAWRSPERRFSFENNGFIEP